MSQAPWEEEANPLDLNDSMDDRVQVPIAFTQAASDWLPEAGHALFPRVLRVMSCRPKQMHPQLWQCLIALAVPLALTLLDLP